MSKNRRGNQVVLCEHCGGSGRVKVQSTKRRRGSARSKVQTFETTVAAIAPNGWAPGSNGFNSRPNEPEFDPIDQGPLKPGEHRESRAFRQRSSSDLGIPLLTNFVSVGVVMVSTAAVCGFIRAMLIPQDWSAWLTWARGPQLLIGQKWWAFTTLGGVGTMGYLWFKMQLPDLLDDMKLVTTEQESSRPTEAPPIVQEAPSAKFVINTGKTQTRAKLSAPKSNHAGLWLYAQALVAGTAAPSYEGGKGVLGAKTYKYTPAEFDGPRGDEWRPTAIKAGLLELDPHKSKGYRLTKTGQRAMGAIVKGRIGEWG